MTSGGKGAASVGDKRPMGARATLHGIGRWVTAMLTSLYFVGGAIISRTGAAAWLVGRLNRRMGFIRSVFFCYAFDEAAIRSYGPAARVRWIKWTPVPIGVLRQGRYRGLVLAAPISEADIARPENAKDFAGLIGRLKKIARLLDVDVVNLAGRLPGILFRDGERFFADPRPATVSVILRALDRLSDRYGILSPPPTILLGGAGFIGEALERRLNERGQRCVVIDPKTGGGIIPPDLRGQPALLVDLSPRDTISGYLDQLWPGLIVLKETFPPPTVEIRAALAAKSIDVFHLSGVEGRIVPALPAPYDIAVPCCAVHDMEGSLEPRLVKL